MPKQFNAEDVAIHRQRFKAILSEGRTFVNTTTLEEFTRTSYRKRLARMIDQLKAECESLEDQGHVEPHH